MYADSETRDRDIERDATRPQSEQLADLAGSAARLQNAAAAPADWSRTVELRNGVTDSASRIPFRRRVEVELHHVDLGIGYELEDLSDEFTAREIDFLAERFAGHPAVVSTSVADSTGGSGRPAAARRAGPSWSAARRPSCSAGSAGGGTAPP